MASEKTEEVPVTTAEVVTIAVTTLDNPDALGEFLHTVAKNAPQRLPIIVIRATAARKWLQKLEAMGEQEILREHIIGLGQDFTDTDTGVLYEFRGDLAERKVANPRALRDALLKAGAPQTDVDRAVFQEWKTSFTELNKLAQTDRTYAEIIEDHEAERKFRPPHMVAKE
jgi:hypothetical protein